MERVIVQLGGDVDPLKWVLPLHDWAYQQDLLLRAQNKENYSRLDGLISSIWLCLAFLILRYLWNSGFQAYVGSKQRRLDAGSSSGQSSKGGNRLQKIEEAIWVTIGGTVLVVVGWRCLLIFSHTCGLWSTAGCLANWPLLPVDPRVHAYYNLELGWYLHLLLKHTLGLGLEDGSALSTHHLVAVVLIIMSYMLNVHTVGLMVFALLNMSTPLLHASKLANLFSRRGLASKLFAGFAAVFFTTRVLLFPIMVLKCAMFDTHTHIRGLFKYFLPYWLIVNVLLVALWVMQMFWFGSILRILRAVVAGNDSQLDREMKAAGRVTCAPNAD